MLDATPGTRWLRLRCTVVGSGGGVLVAEPLCSGPTFVGYGVTDGVDPFYIVQREGAHAGGAGSHLAFVAPSTATVDAFHVAGAAHGGRDNGPPGLRAQYAPDYCAAFLVDPDRHRLEAAHQGS